MFHTNRLQHHHHDPRAMDFTFFNWCVSAIARFNAFFGYTTECIELFLINNWKHIDEF